MSADKKQMDKAIEEDSARRALWSSGIVALGTLVLVKKSGLPLDTALPASIVVALGFDFLVNQQEAKESVLEDTQSISDYFSGMYRAFMGGGGTVKQEAWNYEQVIRSLVLVLGLLGGARVVINQFASVPPYMPLFLTYPQAPTVPLERITQTLYLGYHMPGQIGYPLPDIVHPLPPDIAPMVEALSTRCIRQVRDQFRADIADYNSGMDIRLGRAIRSSLTRAARDIKGGILSTSYEKGSCAIINDNGRRSVVVWNDRSRRTESIPMVVLNEDELEQKVMELVDPELSQLVPVDDPMLQTFSELGVSANRIHDIIRSGASTIQDTGVLTVGGEVFHATEYRPGFGGPEKMVYRDDATGVVRTFELPIMEEDHHLAPYEMDPVARQFLREEIVQLRDARPGLSYTIVVADATNRYYLAVEFLMDEPQALVVLPADRLEERAGRGVEVVGYDSPTPSDFGISDVEDYMENMIDLLEDHGSFRGQIAQQIQYDAERGVYMMRLEDSKYVMLTEKNMDRSEAATLERTMSDDEMRGYLGVRTFSKSGNTIKEVLYVQDGYAMVGESKFSKGFWRSVKTFVIPLTHLVKSVVKASSMI